ncbi:hypothetical protein D2A91_13810 [Enterococcus faecalis]|nr:hypothetical protein [Enterococcus faecalis]
MGKILRKLCETKEVKIIEVLTMPSQIHMLVKISLKLITSGLMSFLRKSAVTVHEWHTNLKIEIWKLIILF